MANDDYFRILYVILTELYEAKKQGEKVNLDDISPERFKVAESYWLDIVGEATEKGYIRGALIRETKTGRVVAGLEGMTITMDGIEYLQDNSKMKKVYESLKELKDWTSIF